MTTRIVPTTYTSLSAAIADSIDGDVIEIRGDFTENDYINITKQLTIIGRRNTDETRPKMMINVVSMFNDLYTAIILNNSNITVKGIIIMPLSTNTPDTILFNLNTTEKDPIYANNYRNAIIDDCEITYYNYCIISNQLYFTLQNNHFIFSGSDTCNTITIQTQNNTININNNLFSASSDSPHVIKYLSITNPDTHWIYDTYTMNGLINYSNNIIDTYGASSNPIITITYNNDVSSPILGQIQMIINNNIFNTLSQSGIIFVFARGDYIYDVM